MKRQRINDRKIPPKEKPYVIEDEGGCHLANEMFCDVGETDFEIGDRVIVTNKFNEQRTHLSCEWFPDLAGKEGVVHEIITTTPIAHEPLDQYIYVIKFDQPFRRGPVSNEDLIKWGYTAETWSQEETEWSFLLENEQLCKST